MQDHRQVDPLSLARPCAHTVETKGSNGRSRPLVAQEEVRPPRHRSRYPSRDPLWADSAMRPFWGLKEQGYA
jgi:hypothetical protein